MNTRKQCRTTTVVVKSANRTPPPAATLVAVEKMEKKEVGAWGALDRITIGGRRSRLVTTMGCSTGGWRWYQRSVMDAIRSFHCALCCPVGTRVLRTTNMSFTSLDSLAASSRRLGKLGSIPGTRIRKEGETPRVRMGYY